ncbi:FHA domain-containing protein [Ruania suaedae]|uniref:FHA domain-containing protein n=1 Tax=Ruania suaedae TaxID=2897774 RepID=UPI001E2EC65D|nr:FHA domain-containing protein [Ruania suaedae]UFU01741.1 FHA domain-containing protein [Ruania suaedae]
MTGEQWSRYRTGAWTAVVTPSGTALLHPGYAVEDVLVLWEAMAAGAPIGEWLEALAGGGITGLADFALAQRTDTGLRVLVRGGAVVTVGEQVLRAEGMSTWREAVVPLPSGEVVTVASGDGLAAPGPDGIPLVAGVVQAEVVCAAAAPPAGAGLEPVAEPASVPEQEPESVPESAPEPEAEPAPEPEPEPEPEPASAPDAASESALRSVLASEATMHPGAEPPAGPSIIDSLPWSVRSSQPSAPPASFAAPDEVPAEQDIDEHTIRVPRRRDPGPDAAVDAPPAQQSGRQSAGPAGAWEGDHDGSTMLVSEVAAMRGAAAAAPGEAGQAPPTQPATEAVTEAVEVLLLSTGLRVALDRPVLIGRAPESKRFAAGVEPRLVTVPSPQQDISRTHVELRREGDHLLVTDLNSTNGTIVVLPGSAPRRLHAGEAVPVRADTRIDLGDGVTGTIEAPAPPP